MRRTLPALVAASLLLAACGDDDDGSTADTSAADETDSTESADSAAGDTEAPADEDDSVTTEAPVDEDESDTAEAADEPVADYPEKPDVEIPAEPPTELITTTIIEGEGPEAADGDTIVVDYVGVRSVDGVEFDASYNRQTPITLVLGRGDVIPGWDQGLQDVQEGERLRVDIPSELAYGEEARSDVIGENEALTFVVDVRAIYPTSEMESPDEEDLEPSEGVSETIWEDIVVGEGEELSIGDTAVFHFAMFRGDDLQQLQSSWQSEPAQVDTGDESTLLPGMLTGMPGMRVGGRRAIIMPPEEGFGTQGVPEIDLPPDTDLILVVDLLAVE